MSKRPNRVREAPEQAAFARRAIRSVGTRVQSDIPSLPLLAELADVVEVELRRSVTVAREVHGFSWTDIGRELGCSRQAAHKRFAGSGS